MVINRYIIWNVFVVFLECIRQKNVEKQESNCILEYIFYPVSPSTVSSMGKTWILLPYLTSGQGWIDTTSDKRTLRLFLTFLFMRIFSSLHVSSERTIQTVSFLRFPFSKTVSPLNNWSSSILAWDKATTELSSLTASSTKSLFGRSFLRRIAVARSSGLQIYDNKEMYSWINHKMLNNPQFCP